jgi:hypothetical protein
MGIGLTGTFIAPTSQGAGIAWNRTSTGRTCFTNQQGSGTGGWEWLSYSNTNVPNPNPQMTLDASGNLNVGGTVTLYAAPTAANHATTKAYVDAAIPTIEYATINTLFTGGIFSANGRVNIHLARFGRMVTLTLANPIIGQNTTSGFGGSLVADVPVPLQFRPARTIEFPIRLANGADGANINEPGFLFMVSSGFLSFRTANGVTWSTGSPGCQYLSYLIGDGL